MIFQVHNGVGGVTKIPDSIPMIPNSNSNENRVLNDVYIQNEKEIKKKVKHIKFRS